MNFYFLSVVLIAFTNPAAGQTSVIPINPMSSALDEPPRPEGAPAPVSCPIDIMKNAVATRDATGRPVTNANGAAITNTKRSCEAEGLSDTNTESQLQAFNLTWGASGEFKASIIPLTIKDLPATEGSSRKNFEINYYRNGAHTPGQSQYFPQDAQICDPAPEQPNSTKLVCPRKRSMFCENGQLSVISPDGTQWPVKVEPMPPASFAEVFAKDNPPPSLTGGLSPACYVTGQIPPVSAFPWLYNAEVTSETVAPAAPATTPQTDGAQPVAPVQ